MAADLARGGAPGLAVQQDLGREGGGHKDGLPPRLCLTAAVLCRRVGAGFGGQEQSCKQCYGMVCRPASALRPQCSANRAVGWGGRGQTIWLSAGEGGVKSCSTEGSPLRPLPLSNPALALCPAHPPVMRCISSRKWGASNWSTSSSTRMPQRWVCGHGAHFIIVRRHGVGPSTPTKELGSDRWQCSSLHIPAPPPAPIPHSSKLPLPAARRRG